MSKSMEKRVEIMKSAKILQFVPKILKPIPVNEIMESIRAEFDNDAIESIRKELEAQDDEN